MALSTQKSATDQRTCTSTTNLSLDPEKPPAGFDVKFRYTSSARDLDKVNIWLGLVVNMARLALNYWNHELTGQIKFPGSNNFVLTAISSSKPPHFQTKTMLWTLQEAFVQYRSRGQYSSAALTTTIDERPLGFMTIKSKLTSPRMPSQINQEVGGRRGLVIPLEYTLNGAMFSDTAIFSPVMELLVYAAEGQPKSQASGNVALYNNEEDFTLSIGPMLLESRDDLSLERLIEILAKLPQQMYEQQRGGRWAELKSIIKYDGLKIGRIGIKKGNHVNGCIDPSESTTTS
ncbi:MAG: hypothetical protein Q9170_001476 [Blastenia crenularia]